MVATAITRPAGRLDTSVTVVTAGAIVKSPECLERVRYVTNQVIRVLEADADPNRRRPDSRSSQRRVVELTVGRRGHMADDGVDAAEARRHPGHAQAVAERHAGRAVAVRCDRHDRAVPGPLRAGVEQLAG